MRKKVEMRENGKRTRRGEEDIEENGESGRQTAREEVEAAFRRNNTCMRKTDGINRQLSVASR